MKINKTVKLSLMAALLLLGLSLPARADLIDLIVDFNLLADGATNAQVQQYLRDSVGNSSNTPNLPNAPQVWVYGAKGEKNYDGDGHVVGPCTFRDGDSDCDDSSDTGLDESYVTPLTLGTSDGASMGGTPRPFDPVAFNALNSSQKADFKKTFFDTFLTHDGSYKKDGKQAIKFKFVNLPFLLTQVEFDFQIFPSNACTKLNPSSCSNKPDFTFYVDGIKAHYQLAITPPADNNESRCTDKNTYNSPFDPGASGCFQNNTQQYETVPQWIGTVSIDLTSLPGFNLNSFNHTFEFVDWPEMIGIDNFNMPRRVPEPGTLLLLGMGGLASVWLKKKRS
jgi:hypothetical protein